MLGFQTASTLDALQHWGAVACITPVLIGLSYLSFRFVETPAIAATTALTSRARTLARRLTPRAGRP